MLINHLQEIDWTTLRIIKVNSLRSFKVNSLRSFKVNSLRSFKVNTSLIYCLTSQTSAKINVKISDLIYNQSQCVTFAKSIIMFVTSIISANNSNKLQRYLLHCNFIQHLCKHKKKIFFIKYFFFHHPKKSK